MIGSGCWTICTNWANWPPRTECAWAMRRWPGAAMSPITAMPGRWCAMSIIPPSGWCSTAFHSLARRIPSASIGDIRADKLFIVQVADAPYVEMDYLNWSRHFRCMPGQGDFPLAEYAAAIRRTGYDGYWSLEIFNDRFRAGSGSQIARDGHRSPAPAR